MSNHTSENHNRSNIETQIDLYIMNFRRKSRAFFSFVVKWQKWELKCQLSSLMHSYFSLLFQFRHFDIYCSKWWFMKDIMSFCRFINFYWSSFDNSTFVELTGIRLFSGDIFPSWDSFEEVLDLFEKVLKHFLCATNETFAFFDIF